MHPGLRDGPCFHPLLRLLRCGALVVGITGSRLETHAERFVEAIPSPLRSNVMLAVETGRLLYRCAPDGTLVRDGALDDELINHGKLGSSKTHTHRRRRCADLWPHRPPKPVVPSERRRRACRAGRSDRRRLQSLVGSKPRCSLPRLVMPSPCGVVGVVAFDDNTVDSLVTAGRAALVRFYDDLSQQLERREGPLLDVIPADGPLAFLRSLPGTADALHPPISDDHERVPRIEVRGDNAAVVWVGIPAQIAGNYHNVPEHLIARVDGKPTGRM